MTSVKLPTVVLLGLPLGNRVRAPDFCGFSTWPFKLPFRLPFNLPLSWALCAGFLGFFARPLLWTAMAALSGL